MAMSGHLLLCRDQSGGPDQVIGDQIEQKIGGDGCNAAVSGNQRDRRARRK